MAISAPPTKDASRAPWPNPKSRWASGSPRTQNATAAGSSTVIASRMARMVSAATPARSPAAASRDADGSTAVASETVTRE
jgi:hypothetical protein